jgi:hypothetical protein
MLWAVVGGVAEVRCGGGAEGAAVGRLASYATNALAREWMSRHIFLLDYVFAFYMIIRIRWLRCFHIVVPDREASLVRGVRSS